MLLNTLLSIALVVSTEALPTISSHHVLHEKRELPPSRWQRSNRVDPDAIIPVRIGLTQTNLDSAYEHLMRLSHPDSEHYGKHLSAEEVHSLFAPEDEAVAAVRAWLAESGVKDAVHSDNKGWLAIDMPVHETERLFKAEYHEYEHANGDLRIGCDEYHLPAHIKEHVDYVTPGVKMSARLMKRSLSKREASHWNPSRPGRPFQVKAPYNGPWQMPPGAHGLPPDLQDCGRNITPTCIRALYDIPKAWRKDSVNSVGLYEAGDIYSREDVNLFFAKYAPCVPQNTTPIAQYINGADAPVAPGSPFNNGESDIDIDMTTSLVYPQTVTLYQTDDLPNQELEITGQGGISSNTFLDAVDGSYCTYKYANITGNTPGIDPSYPDPAPGGYKGQLQCGIYKPTRVISVSYGEAEADLPINYQKRQCNEYMKLALQGHTLLFSASDYGVGSFPYDTSSPSGCLSGSGQNQTVYNPDYPSNCPYVTSVGATMLTANQTIHDPESAMQVGVQPNFASGGGFSNYFSPPSYQQAALDEYFANHNPGHPYYHANAQGTNIGNNGGIYNRGGRGYPDISANGANFKAFINLTDTHTYGTSLASPLWASVITLINSERTAAGKGPVGFLNPVLYAHPHVLKDITNGSNPNCGSSGFKAVPGWDPITGLGTPKYPALLALFMSLP